MELQVFIEVFAPIPEAYLRMAHAMDEVKKFLIPVSIPGSFLLQPKLFQVVIYGPSYLVYGNLAMVQDVPCYCHVIISDLSC